MAGAWSASWLFDNRLSGEIPSELGSPDQPEVPVPLWQSADGEDALGVGGQLVLGLQSRRDCRMPKTTTWTSWDLSTVPRLSHSYPPARATFTFRDKAAWGRAVGTLLARSLGAVTFSSLQAHPPRVPQFFVSIRNRGSWSGGPLPRTALPPCASKTHTPPLSPSVTSAGPPSCWGPAPPRKSTPGAPPAPTCSAACSGARPAARP